MQSSVSMIRATAHQCEQICLPGDDNSGANLDDLREEAIKEYEAYKQAEKDEADAKKILCCKGSHS